MKRTTDMPLLVRMDTKKLLSAKDVVANYQAAELKNYVSMIAPGSALPTSSVAMRTTRRAI